MNGHELFSSAHNKKNYNIELRTRLVDRHVLCTVMCSMTMIIMIKRVTKMKKLNTKEESKLNKKIISRSSSCVQ